MAKAPKIPDPPPVQPLPQPDDPESVDARRNVARQARERRGVASTLLSGELGDAITTPTRRKRLLGPSTE